MLALDLFILRLSLLLPISSQLVFIQIDQIRHLCSFVPNPVLVIIGVQPKELGIPTKAYYAVEEVKEVELNNFVHMILLTL